MTRALGRGDIVLSHFSLPRDTAFEDRLRAAAAAGFDGIGWFVADYVKHRDLGWTDQRIQKALDDHGLVLHEIDAIPLARLDHADVGVHMVNTFGAHHLQVQGNRPESLAESVDIVSRLADGVAESGGCIAIEFVGNMNIRTAAEALEIAEATARNNVGVQVDIWHHVRGANDWSMLETLSPAHIASVQFDDGPLAPVLEDYTEDTIRFRALPGRGEFDIPRFLETVYGPEVRLPLSVEVISDELMALGIDEAARLMYEATKACLGC
jgi:sugar phosphate isomerase/epimerase